MSTLRRHLVVTGMPGTGKSKLTTKLAARFDVGLRDSDTDIEVLFGESGQQIAERDGVAALHRVESAVLLGALAVPQPGVIAAAGSVIDDAACRTALDRTADLFVLAAADPTPVPGTRHRRPIDLAEVEALVARRMPLWQQHAVEVLDADSSVTELVERISDRVR